MGEGRYSVFIQPSAELDIESAYQWIAGKSPDAAMGWYYALHDAIASLAEFPARCAEAPEGAHLLRPVRQRLVGDYRILFVVEDKAVHVLHVRHGARSREAAP